MSTFNPIADMHISYTLTSGDSGRTKVRFGTMVAIEEYYGDSFGTALAESTGARGIAMILWCQLYPKSDLIDEEAFRDFYMTIDSLELELGAEVEDDPKESEPSPMTSNVSLIHPSQGELLGSS